jgi:hypothetical protein
MSSVVDVTTQSRTRRSKPLLRSCLKPFEAPSPEIVLVAEPESGEPQPQAYVEQGSTRIYVNTNGQGYLGAAGGNKDALKFLASVIAHEHAHALHGASEAEAYAVQIDTLKALKAPKGIVRAVEEAAAHVNKQTRRGNHAMIVQRRAGRCRAPNRVRLPQ